MSLLILRYLWEVEIWIESPKNPIIYILSKPKLFLSIYINYHVLKDPQFNCITFLCLKLSISVLLRHLPPSSLTQTSKIYHFNSVITEQLCKVFFRATGILIFDVASSYSPYKQVGKRAQVILFKKFNIRQIIKYELFLFSIQENSLSSNK